MLKLLDRVIDLTIRAEHVMMQFAYQDMQTHTLWKHNLAFFLRFWSFMYFFLIK